MANAKWTIEQEQAILAGNGDILVAAAAGSGKTAVLVERIITLITQRDKPVDVDRLLVVTFTKAAASEMSQRIREALNQKLEQYPKDEHIKKQLIYLNRADIKTIDSFFLKVIKENYSVLGIDPAIHTADEAQTALLKNEVMEEVFEDLYANEENESFFSLIESYGSDTSDVSLKELILKIYTFVQSNPFPEKWLTEMGGYYQLSQDASFGKTIWAQLIMEELRQEVDGCIVLLQEAQAIATREDGPTGYQKAIGIELDRLEYFRCSAVDCFEHAYQALQGFAFEKRIGVYRGEFKELAQAAKGLRNRAKETIESLRERYFSMPDEKVSSFILHMQPVILELFRVVTLFSERYQKEKKDRMLLDFNDYGHFCLKVLLEQESTPKHIIPTPAALALQQRYEEVLIDEYQDSNLIQEMALSAISRKSVGKHNRFLVGDIKQSIYKFRLAQPEIFMEKYETFLAQAGGLERRIDLSKNFRSRKNILECINFLFMQLMTKKLGDIVYDEKAALYLGASFPPEDGCFCGGQTELHLIDTSTAAKEDTDSLQELSMAELEAMLTARRIKELIKAGFMVLDKATGVYRQVRFGDFAVLLRSQKNWSNVFTEVLEQELIPAYAQASKGYFDTVEITTALHFLSIIDNPRQDIPLLSILHSPLYHFSSSELLEIRLGGGSGDFYDSILQYMDTSKRVVNENDSGLQSRLSHFLKELSEYRRIAPCMPISRLISLFLNQSGYIDYVGALARGQVRQANLRFLIQKAADYEAVGLHGLFHFVQYIGKLKKRDMDSGEAVVLNENENIVQIMTIHKSKGLEFPVVFVCGLGRKFNKMDLRNPLLLHQKYGVAGDYIDFESRVAYATPMKAALAAKMDRESLSEEMRIFYVALTRAKEKLILIGSVGNLNKKIAGWSLDAMGSEIELSSYKMTKAQSPLDWIAPALARHKNGAAFWEKAGITLLSRRDEIYLHSAQWEIFFYTRDDFSMEAKEEKQKIEVGLGEELAEAIQGGNREEMSKSLYWVYAHQKSVRLPSNISISEMKRKQLASGEESFFDNSFFGNSSFEYPQFSERGIVSATSVGTALHSLMERLDFKKIWHKDEIHKEIQSLLQKGIVTSLQADAIDITLVEAFFQSEIAARAALATELHKETPFTVALTPEEAYGAEYAGIEEKILLHGIVDCYFYEGEEIVLLDYKSDSIGEGGEMALVKRYRLQLSLYRRALEAITGKRVKESVVYSFTLKKGIPV